MNYSKLEEKKERIGDWQETYTGKFWALDPKIEDVSLRDIAHALSQICRFVGHTKHFYSIAQHCLNVYKVLESQGYDEKIQLMGLLHDASEAYACDIPSPLKRCLPEYKKVENKIEEVIYSAFGIEHTDEDKKIIKSADVLVLLNEAAVLMNNTDNWIYNYGYEPCNIDTSLRDMKTVEGEYFSSTIKLIKRKRKRKNKSILIKSK
ncbi:MAG: phosphohydrolase [Bacilli bacterium]|nr:phosphohydrolase [Bacilli bacterium]